MQYITNQACRKDVVRRIKSLMMGMRHAFDDLRKIHESMSQYNIAYTGVEGHGDHVHMMNQILTLQLQAFQMLGSAANLGNLISEQELVQISEWLKTDVDYAHEAYVSL